MKKKVTILVFVLAILFQGRLWAIQWDPVATGYSYHFHAVKFCDAAKGVIVGQQAILRTTDGGENWNRVFNDPSRTVYDVDGEGDILFALADWGRIYRSTNCGQTWNRVQLFKKDLYSLAVPSAERPEKVVVVGPDGIFRTYNGEGRTVSIPRSDNFKSVHFIDANNGFIAGENGTVLATNNGGSTWSQLVSPGEGLSLRRIFASSISDIFITERTGNLCVSSWGGWAWRMRTATPGIDYQSIAFGVNRYRMVGSQGKIAVSNNEGETWEEEDSGTNALLRDIIYAAPAHRWFAVGNNGTLLRSRLLTLRINR